MNKGLIWIAACCGLFAYCKPTDTSHVKVFEQKIINSEHHRIRLASLDETRDFYTWTSDRIPMVSAHRGGPYPGFPENAIETFANI